MIQTRNETQPRTVTPATAAPGPNNVVLLLYHRQDEALYNNLLPHLNLMVCRSQGLRWRAFQYPLIGLRSQQEASEQFLTHLQASVLLVPCTSARLLSTFWHELVHDPAIQAALAHVSVAPIALCPASFVQALCPYPLAAYPAGYPREMACMQVAEALEKRLRKLPGTHRRDQEAVRMQAQTVTLRR